MSKEDTKWRLRDSEGKEYIIIDSEKVDLQAELNKTIEKLIEKNKQLHSIIKEVREILETMEHAEHLFGGVEPTNVDKMLEILDKVGDIK